MTGPRYKRPSTPGGNDLQAQKGSNIVLALVSEVPAVFAAVTPGNAACTSSMETVSALASAIATIHVPPSATSPVVPTAAEVQQATKMWYDQATEWDKATMLPYSGPLQPQFTESSPEVQRLMQAAATDGKLLRAEATSLFNKQATAIKTTHAAAAAAAVAGELSVKTGNAGAVAQAQGGANTTSQVMSPHLSNVYTVASSVPDISAEFAWDGAKGEICRLKQDGDWACLVCNSPSWN